MLYSRGRELGLMLVGTLADMDVDKGRGRERCTGYVWSDDCIRVTKVR
jgi:hypothetical protein